LQELLLLLFIGTGNNSKVAMGIAHKTHFIKANKKVWHHLSERFATLLAHPGIVCPQIIVHFIHYLMPTVLLWDIDIGPVGRGCLDLLSGTFQYSKRVIER
jgi:hypothetical protein